MAMSRSLGSSQVTLRPPIQIWPALTSMSPAMALSRVDLPQPDGPSRTRNSDCSTSSSSPVRTRTEPKAMSTPRTETLEGRAIRSALDRAGGDAAHEPAPGDEVDGERHQRGQQRGGHLDIVFALALGGVDDVV